MNKKQNNIKGIKRKPVSFIEVIIWTKTTKGEDFLYPIRGIWNAVLAGIVYQHISIENLRRELFWEKIVVWFGYKLHLLIDADYELPVAFTVTRASSPEAP